MPVLRVPVALAWNGPGSPGVNVWSVRVTDNVDLISERDAALTALYDFYFYLRVHLATGMTVKMGQDIVDRVSQEDQSTTERTVTSAGTSGNAAPALQVCVSWRTSLRARRGMGRTFIGPLDGDVADTEGTPNATVITDITTATQTLLDASAAATGWAIGVWGLESPGAYDSSGNLIPGQPHVHRDAVGFRVRDQFAILRSRRD